MSNTGHTDNKISTSLALNNQAFAQEIEKLKDSIHRNDYDLLVALLSKYQEVQTLFSSKDTTTSNKKDDGNKLSVGKLTDDEFDELLDEINVGSNPSDDKTRQKHITNKDFVKLTDDYEKLSEKTKAFIAKPVKLFSFLLFQSLRVTFVFLFYKL